MSTTTEPLKTAKPRPKWRRIAKVAFGVVVSVIALIAIILCAIVWILTPERLTPMVEKYASEYLYADVKTSRVELTVWKSFPQLRLDVDSLSVVSHTLRELPDSTRSALPTYADTLLQVDHLTGGINLAKLLIGKFELRNLEIVKPAINLVQATPTATNYMIVPPSDDTESSDTSIPDITLDRFTIVGDSPIRYISIPDSIAVELTLATSGLYNDKCATPYTLSAHGLSSLSAYNTPLLDNLSIGLNGRVDWSADNPMTVRLTNFDIALDSIRGTMAMEMSFDEPMTVNSATLSIAPTPVQQLIRYIPDGMVPDLSTLRTSLIVSADATLTAPYHPTTDIMPSVDVNIHVPTGNLSYQGYDIDSLCTDVAIKVDGQNPDASVITVDDFDMDCSGVCVQFNGSFTHLMTDPYIEGSFKGEVDLQSLPPFITKQIPATIAGQLEAATDFHLHHSDLSREHFHCAYVSGDVDLRNFRMSTPDSMFVYMRSGCFRLGTQNSVTATAGRVDSLLTASLKIDTASIVMPDMQVYLSKASLGFGARNKHTSDTTAITPLGGKISIARLDYNSVADSSRIRMRTLECNATLQRYQGNSRVPDLSLKATAGRISYADGLNRMSVRNSEFAVNAHLNPRQKMPAKIQARYDSIAAAHPGITPDSVVSIMHNSFVASQRKANTEQLDLAVDNSIGRLLRRWNVSGRLLANSGRMVTPYFPLHNRLKDLNMQFTTDSIALNSCILTSGSSDMSLKGNISNIRKALTSGNTSPLKVRLSVKSDTLNINELTNAAFMGSAFGAKADSLLAAMNPASDDDALQRQLDATASADTIMSAILVPTNIDASLRMSAKNVLYSDVLFHDFRGSLMAYDGNINLNRLSAKADIGSVDLTALYSAPTKHDISFGFSLGVHDFYIDRFGQIMPFVVDSLMPIMNGFKGIINADVAAITSVDSLMNIDLPSLHAAIKISGDSLVLLDHDTFRTLSRWLLFKNKNRNMIDHMAVEMTIDNSQLEFYPFMFDIDRYRLGVMGHNDLAMNLNYHISVLKSPLPFKFGINVTGNADKMKIRLGRARFKENMVGERTAIAETTRVNLVQEIERVFRRGARAARLGRLNIAQRPTQLTDNDIANDTISHADSLAFANEGLITMPVDTTAVSTATLTTKKSKKSKK